MNSAPDGSTARRRAWRSPLAWAVLLSIFGVGLFLDLGLKHWAFQHVAPNPVVLDRETISQPHWQIPPHEPVAVIPHGLNLHLVKNDGAVFGIGASQRMFFVVFTMAALTAAVVVFGRWTNDRATAAHIAIGLILAGGFGNLVDRLRFGFVRDFLHMLPGWNLPFGWHWRGGNPEVFPWVFNVADMMLLIGMAILMLYMNSVEKQRRLARERAEAATQPESV